MVKVRQSSGTDTQSVAVDLAAALDKATVIARCMGVLALRLSPTRRKTDTERIRFLKGLGFDRNDIAAILETKPSTVSVRLSEMSTKPKRSKKKPKGRRSR